MDNNPEIKTHFQAERSILLNHFLNGFTVGLVVIVVAIFIIGCIFIPELIPQLLSQTQSIWTNPIFKAYFVITIFLIASIILIKVIKQ